MHMQELQIGIVGLGYWGPNLVRNFYAAKHCTVAMCCDLEPANLAAIQKKYPTIQGTANFADLLENDALNLICIATPTASHFTLAMQALKVGKNVLIEKPMCQTSAQAEELNILAESLGLQIFVDHTFVFAPAVQKLADYVQAGSLGDLLYFESSRINLGIIQPDCNVLWDLAIHDLSILSTIIDLNTATEVSAYGSAHYGKPVEVAHMDILFESGFHAHIYASWLSPVKLRKTVLAGTKAIVTFDDIEPSEKIRFYDKGIEGTSNQADPFFPKYRSGDIVIPVLPTEETLSLQVDSIISSLQQSTPAAVSGRSAQAMLRLLEAADESLAIKRTISL